MSLTIEIKTIPQNQHRYPTLGDYVGHERLRFIQVSDMGNAKYEFLIAVHELIEQALCLEHGVSEETITLFDMAWECAGREGEPGDSPEAPYHREHTYAQAVEYALCKELGLEPAAYDRFLTEYLAKENL